MADNPQLVVALTARIDQFEKQLKDAGRVAENEIKNIENITKGVAIGSTIASFATKALEEGFKSVKKSIEDAYDQMLKLGELTRRTGVDLETIQRIGATTRLSGISDKELFEGVSNVAVKMDEINRRTTQLSQFLDANNAKYKDQTGHIIDANKALELAAELMLKAKSVIEQEEIAKMFGLTKDWVQVLGQGPDHFRKMKAEAANVNPELALMVQHATALNKLSNTLDTIFKGWGNSIIVGVLPALETAATALAKFAEGLAALTVGGPIEQISKKAAEQWKEVAAAIKTANEEANKTRIEVRPSGKGLNWATDGATAISNLERFDDQFSKHLGLLQAESDATGKTRAEREVLRQTALLEEAAKRDGLTLEQALTAERQKQLDKAKAIVEQDIQRKAQLEQLTNVSRELGQVMSNAFADMVLEGKKFNDVLNSALKQLSRFFLNQAFNSVFAAPSGGGTAPFVQLLQGLFRAAGGPAMAGHPYIVGERGPELFVPRTSGAVVPNSAMASTSAPAAMSSVVQNNSFISGLTPTDRAWIESRLDVRDAQLRQVVQRDVRKVYRARSDSYVG